MLGEFTLRGIISARIDLSICIKPEVLDEAATRFALAGRIVNRQVDEVSLRLGRGSTERRLRRDIL